MPARTGTMSNVRRKKASSKKTTRRAPRATQGQNAPTRSRRVQNRAAATTPESAPESAPEPEPEPAPAPAPAPAAPVVNAPIVHLHPSSSGPDTATLVHLFTDLVRALARSRSSQLDAAYTRIAALAGLLEESRAREGVARRRIRALEESRARLLEESVARECAALRRVVALEEARAREDAVRAKVVKESHAREDAARRRIRALEAEYFDDRMWRAALNELWQFLSCKQIRFVQLVKARLSSARLDRIAAPS